MKEKIVTDPNMSILISRLNMSSFFMYINRDAYRRDAMKTVIREKMNFRIGADLASTSGRSEPKVKSMYPSVNNTGSGKKWEFRIEFDIHTYMKEKTGYIINPMIR